MKYYNLKVLCFHFSFVAARTHAAKVAAKRNVVVLVAMKVCVVPKIARAVQRRQAAGIEIPITETAKPLNRP